MFGYAPTFAPDLQVARATMPSDYEPVPKSVADQIVSKAGGNA